MRKIIDENGRFFGKISFIDVVVLIAVVVVVLTIALKPEVQESISGSTDTVPVEYVLVNRNIRQTVADMFKEGDIMYTEGGVSIGKITGVRSEPAKLNSQLVDGTYAEGVIESKVDTYITILADCSHSNGRYYANRSYELFVNKNDKFVTKYAMLTATLYEINP